MKYYDKNGNIHDTLCGSIFADITHKFDKKLSKEVPGYEEAASVDETDDEVTIVEDDNLRNYCNDEVYDAEFSDIDDEDADEEDNDVEDIEFEEIDETASVSDSTVVRPALSYKCECGMRRSSEPSGSICTICGKPTNIPSSDPIPPPDIFESAGATIHVDEDAKG